MSYVLRTAHRGQETPIKKLIISRNNSKTKLQLSKNTQLDDLLRMELTKAPLTQFSSLQTLPSIDQFHKDAYYD